MRGCWTLLANVREKNGVMTLFTLSEIAWYIYIYIYIYIYDGSIILRKFWVFGSQSENRFILISMKTNTPSISLYLGWSLTMVTLCLYLTLNMAQTEHGDLDPMLWHKKVSAEWLYIWQHGSMPCHTSVPNVGCEKFLQTHNISLSKLRKLYSHE